VENRGTKKNSDMKNCDGSGGGPPVALKLNHSRRTHPHGCSSNSWIERKTWLFLKYDSFTLHVLQNSYSLVNF